MADIKVYFYDNAPDKYRNFADGVMENASVIITVNRKVSMTPQMNWVTNNIVDNLTAGQYKRLKTDDEFIFITQ